MQEMPFANRRSMSVPYTKKQTIDMELKITQFLQPTFSNTISELHAHIVHGITAIKRIIFANPARSSMHLKYYSNSIQVATDFVKFRKYL